MTLFGYGSGAGLVADREQFRGSSGDFKNEDDLKNEDNLIHEDDLKKEDDFRNSKWILRQNENDLKN